MTAKLDDKKTYFFRDIHPFIHMGTASDRYAGWLGQIYTKERYENRIKKRIKKVGAKSYTEEVLPIDSVQEYFEHFDVLEIDYTFYTLLLHKDKGSQRLKPSPNYHVLASYEKHMSIGDSVFLKVPQLIFTRSLYRSGRHIENDSYLNADIFTKQFYEPAVKILGGKLGGFIFEQEYQRKQNRIPVKDMVSDLNSFFSTIPRDDRYHLELRTESYLSKPMFEVMQKYQVGQVLSHWTWLPRLLKQFAKPGNRFINSKQCVVRLITPIGIRYEQTYAMAHPFDHMVDGMLQPEMISETVALMKEGIEQGVHMNIIVNNRAGGNASSIAREIVNHYRSVCGSDLLWR